LIVHAEVRIGDSVVMMFDSRPGWPPTPAFLRLYVLTDVTHLFFGDREERVRDPLSNIWWMLLRQGRRA